MAADHSKFSYFSLPPEIRNKIMNLVLVPGDVYPHTPVPKTPTREPVAAANVQSRSGVQLIATCRQAYDEGHALFYSSNIFHLPATMTFEWSDRLQPKHKRLIKRIGITIGPNELDASMIGLMDEKYCESRPPEHEFDVIQDVIVDTLHNCWNAKMKHIAAWISLEEITFCLFEESCKPTSPLHGKYNLQHHEHTIPHCELVANLESFDVWSEEPYWDKIIRWPCILVLANIVVNDDELSWAKTIDWLYERKPDELAEGFWEGVQDLDTWIHDDCVW